MEQGLIKNPVLRSYLYMALYEFMGMTIFLIGINCSQNNASVAALGLFISATLTGRLSGGHFNMAITSAVYLVEAKWLQNIKVALCIMLVDLLGAFFAMAVSKFFLGNDHTFALIPPGEKNNFSVSYFVYIIMIEAFFTMIFVSMVLFIKYRRVSATTDGMLSNLTVAIGLFVSVMMAGPLSGAALNPTIAIAIITTDTYFQDNNKGHALFLIPYILGPLIGALAAAGLVILSQKITLDSEETDAYEAAVKGEPAVEDVDFDGRRASARGMTIELDQAQSKGYSLKRRETGLERRSARDYMA